MDLSGVSDASQVLHVGMSAHDQFYPVQNIFWYEDGI